MPLGLVTAACVAPACVILGALAGWCARARREATLPADEVDGGADCMGTCIVWMQTVMTLGLSAAWLATDPASPQTLLYVALAGLGVGIIAGWWLRGMRRRPS